MQTVWELTTPLAVITINGNATLYAKWETVINNNNSMIIIIGSSRFTATLAQNATATALKVLLPLTLNMNEMNNNEKYADLPGSLPTVTSNIGTIQNGDIMLYGSTTLVLFYKTFSTSYSYTKVASIDNPAGLQFVLGSGSVSVKFKLD